MVAVAVTVVAVPVVAVGGGTVDPLLRCRSSSFMEELGDGVFPLGERCGSILGARDVGIE